MPSTETIAQISRERGTIGGISFLQKLSVKTKLGSARDMKEHGLSKLQEHST